jgi:hypothetical protein
MPVKKRNMSVAKKLQEPTHYVGFQMPVALYKHYQRACAENRRSFSSEIICTLEGRAEKEGYERDINVG